MQNMLAETMTHNEVMKYIHIYSYVFIYFSNNLDVYVYIYAYMCVCISAHIYSVCVFLVDVYTQILTTILFESTEIKTITDMLLNRYTSKSYAPL